MACLMAWVPEVNSAKVLSPIVPELDRILQIRVVCGKPETGSHQLAIVNNIARSSAARTVRMYLIAILSCVGKNHGYIFGHTLAV